MKTHSALRPAIVLLAAFSLLLGFGYPALVTGAAQALFPFQANGSIIKLGGRAVGSALLGENFSGPGWFRSRPSATTPYPYNAEASAASNLGPSNPALRKAADARAERLRAENPESTGPVPADLVTASASGLDPHISPAAALYQVERVARERKLPPETVRRLVLSSVEGRTLGILGEPRVNVLELNLALSRISPI